MSGLYTARAELRGAGAARFTRLVPRLTRLVPRFTRLVLRLTPALLFYTLLFLPDFSEFTAFFRAAASGAVVFSTAEALADTFLVYLPLTVLLLSPRVQSFLAPPAPSAPPAAAPPVPPVPAAPATPALALSVFLETVFAFCGLAAVAIAVSNLEIALGNSYAGEILPEDGGKGAICLMLAASAALEETFFRYFCIASFEAAGLPLVPASLVPVILFAIPHIWEGPAGALNAFLAGVFLTTLYLRRRSLVPLILSHGLYNITVFLLGS